MINQVQLDWLISKNECFESWKEAASHFNEKFNTNETPVYLGHYCFYHNVRLKNRKGYHYYTEEQKQWIIENDNGSTADLTKKFNEHFNTNLRKECIQHIRKRLNLTEKNRFYLYSEEYYLWFKENYNKLDNKTLLKEIKDEFGYELSPANISDMARKRFGMLKNNDLIIKNSSPIGHEVIWNDNNVYVKVTNDYSWSKEDANAYKKNYRKKANVEYEKYHNVKIDEKNKIVIFIDGDRRNFSKENLILVDKKTERMYVGKYSSQFKNFSNVKLSKLAIINLELQNIISNGDK